MLINIIKIAEATNGDPTFKSLIETTIVGNILKPVIVLLITLAVLLFIYGVIINIFSEGGQKKETGKMYMLWGIVGLFVIVSMWGLVALLQNTFGLNNNNPINTEINPL